MTMLGLKLEILCPIIVVTFVYKFQALKMSQSLWDKGSIWLLCVKYGEE